MELKQIVSTNKAPAAIGPYSQAVVAGGFIFTAGQIPINPATGKVEETTFKGQVRQVLENLKAVLEAGNSSLENIVKVTVFVSDLSKFSELNEVFNEYFQEKPPARSAVQVSRLPKDVMVEIEGIAIVGGGD